MKKSKKLIITILNSILPVLGAFIIGAIIIAFLDENPFEVYGIMLGNSLFTVKGLLNTLHYASPLLLTGIAIAITFKANIFNMGVEGQLLFGGFFAGIAGATLNFNSSVIQKLVCILIGIIFGILFAIVPAILKAYFRVDEMVVTLMLNYAMVKVLEYLSSGPFREEGSGYVCTTTIKENSMFNRLNIANSKITMFFFIAVIILIVISFIFKRTKLGMEIEAIGKNAEFAEATGMRVRKKIIILMCISGGLAGLAGAGWMMSEKYKYTLTFSGTTGLGWDGMLVALLGKHNPIGILFAAIFYSALKTGADSINMYTSVPKEIVAVLQGLIILFMSIQFLDQIFGLKERVMKKKNTKEVA